MKKTYENSKTYIKNYTAEKVRSGCGEKYPATTIILSFFAFAFIGWVWEVVIHLYLDHMFVNRGTMIGPWLPVYGFGGVLILVLLRRWFDRPGKLFGMILLLCGVVEYAAGAFLETVYHAKWWDYSESLINIQGRVCLEGLLLFGIGGLVIVYIAEPILHRMFQKISSNARIALCVSLMTIFAADFLVSMGNPNTGFGITTM